MSVSVGLITRDKYSAAPAAASALARELPPDCEILVVDGGYPEPVLRAVERELAPRAAWVLEVDAKVSTNAAWNAFVDQSSGDWLLAVENDVCLLPGAFREIEGVLLSGEFDVVVPAVYEDSVEVLHFDPPVSSVTPEGRGFRTSLVRRPKPEHPAVAGTRRIDHVEKHCFAMTRPSATRLGPLDEQMRCRTDLDMSLACHRSGLRIGMGPDAKVVFTRALELPIDREIFDERWDLEAARRSNERLVSKWGLVGYESSIEFVEEMRGRLS